MLKRLKDWLIKRLGGYTKEEYDDWSRIPIVKPPIIREVHRTTELHAAQIINMEELAAYRDVVDLRARERIVSKLTTDMIPYIAWKSSENRRDFTVTLEGVLVVLEQG